VELEATVVVEENAREPLETESKEGGAPIPRLILMKESGKFGMYKGI